MLSIPSPQDPFLLNFPPLTIRWYGVLIVGGALLAGWLAARRAERRGYDPEDVWNLLMLGMVLGVAGARAYYVIFEWPRFADESWLFIVNPANGGLAIHGAIIGAILAAYIYTRYKKLPFVEWLDMCLPTVLTAQAVGRWGNYFNQEAYGRPSGSSFGLIINRPEQRQPPYNDLQQYPLETTLFHPTFLYESIWNIGGFGLIVWLERRLRGWLRTGDSALMYCIWYGIGRFWVEGLRTDSLCTNGIGGSCDGSLRTAQIASVVLVVIGVGGMIINHRRTLRPTEATSDDVADERTEAVEGGDVRAVEQA